MATSTSVNPQILAKAALLRQLGVKPSDGLPSWARQTGTVVDLTRSPYWRPQEKGDTTESLGNADGSGYYAPLEKFAGNPEAAMAELAKTGQQVMEAQQGNVNVRWLQDAQGKVTATPQIGKVDDSAFWTAAGLASSIVGGAVGGNLGGAVVGAANAAGNTAVDTGNFSQALKNALLSVGASYAGSAASSASGLTGAAGNAVGGAVGSGLSTAVRGGNLAETLKSAIIGAAPGVAGATMNNNQSLSPLLATLAKQLASTAVGRKPNNTAGSAVSLLTSLLATKAGG